MIWDVTPACTWNAAFAFHTKRPVLSVFLVLELHFLLYFPIHCTRKFVGILKFFICLVFLTFLHFKKFQETSRTSWGRAELIKPIFLCIYALCPIHPPHQPNSTMSPWTPPALAETAQEAAQVVSVPEPHAVLMDWPLPIKPSSFCFSVNDPLSGDNICRSIIVFETVTLISNAIGIGQPVKKLGWWKRDWQETDGRQLSFSSLNWADWEVGMFSPSHEKLYHSFIKIQNLVSRH